MIIWFSLIIPCLAAILMIYAFQEKFVWWELLLPFGVTLIVITIFKFSVETLMVSDTEYNASLIKSVRYYEPYETWVHRTCYRSYKCGKHTCRVPYDCSRCIPYSAEYKAFDVNNRQYSITSEHYHRLKHEWENSIFIELNRSITYHGFCGRNGDAYESIWDNKIQHAESNIFEKSYENKTKINHSAFHYPDVSKEEVEKLGLFEYPPYYDTYKQNILLGNFKNYVYQLPSTERKFEYLGGQLGLDKGVKIYLLLFEDKGIDIAFKQEAYWEGSNDNEVVICLGIDSKTKQLSWVKPFSWTSGKRTLIDIREDIMEIGRLDMNGIYEVINKSVREHYVKKDFRDFNYLTVDPPLYEILLTYFLALAVTFGVNYWCYMNDHKND